MTLKEEITSLRAELEVERARSRRLSIVVRWLRAAVLGHPGAVLAEALAAAKQSLHPTTEEGEPDDD